jgi:superfamily II DNA helicase RecQ
MYIYNTCVYLGECCVRVAQPVGASIECSPPSCCLSTGSGKTLCYVISIAAMLKVKSSGRALCIIPLVTLTDDVAEKFKTAGILTVTLSNTDDAKAALDHVESLKSRPKTPMVCPRKSLYISRGSRSVFYLS